MTQDLNALIKRIRKALNADRGKRGGRARAKNLSPARRAEIAKLAADTRWQRHKEKK
jgi:hypothetical protein